MKLTIRQTDGSSGRNCCGRYEWRSIELFDKRGRSLLYLYGDDHMTGDSDVREPVEVLTRVLKELGHKVSLELVEVGD